MIISIPSVIILTCLFISLWGGSIRFNTPMLFVMAFLPMFGIGGLTGLPLGFNYSDLHLHDTYYVIAHFHYIVAPGTIFGVFAGIYYWFPKATGRMMSEFWGKVHFWPSLIFMNLIFQPMFAQGMAGMLRRRYDGGQGWNVANDHAIWGLTGFPMEPCRSPGRLGPGARANSFHHQFLLEHQERRKSERQSVGSDDARMASADAAAARQLRHRAGCLSRPLRIQRARPRTRFHHAKRTGGAGRADSAQASRRAVPAIDASRSAEHGNSEHELTKQFRLSLFKGEGRVRVGNNANRPA